MGQLIFLPRRIAGCGESRPAVMRETGVLVKGQQPEGETAEVKELLEGGGDLRHKMRPLDSCPSHYPPNVFLLQNGVSIFLNLVLTPVLILLSPQILPGHLKAFLFLLLSLLAATGECFQRLPLSPEI